jgi:hypothetical protein
MAAGSRKAHTGDDTDARHTHHAGATIGAGLPQPSAHFSASTNIS